MRLDVYVGSITRYLCGNWETVVQQYARETGLPLEVIRNNPGEAITDPNEILPVVLQWRESLSSGLQASGGPALDWDERSEALYFTDKPTWDAYGDLMLWASYSEKGLEPPTASPDEWHDDPVLKSSMDQTTRYPALLRSTEVWFPTDFNFTFRAEWVTGQDLHYGSRNNSHENFKT